MSTVNPVKKFICEEWKETTVNYRCYDYNGRFKLTEYICEEEMVNFVIFESSKYHKGSIRDLLLDSDYDNYYVDVTDAVVLHRGNVLELLEAGLISLETVMEMVKRNWEDVHCFVRNFEFGKESKKLKFDNYFVLQRNILTFLSKIEKYREYATNSLKILDIYMNFHSGFKELMDS